MTFCVDNEIDASFPFSIDELGMSLLNAVLDDTNCEYETTVNLLLTDDEGIREYNRDYRGIDKETDVLSFPFLEFENVGDFSHVDDSEADCFDPDTGELILGDMIINVSRATKQASDYGHSLKREIAFLIAHSLFHLCGYDHINSDEAKIMENKQEEILTKLGIVRE